MQQRTFHQDEMAELGLEREDLERQFTTLFLKRGSAKYEDTHILKTW